MHSEARVLTEGNSRPIHRSRTIAALPSRAPSWRAGAFAWFRRPMTPQALRAHWRGSPASVDGCPGCEWLGLCGTHGWTWAARLAARLSGSGGGAPGTKLSRSGGIRPPPKRPKDSRAPRSGAPSSTLAQSAMPWATPAGGASQSRARRASHRPRARLAPSPATRQPRLPRVLVAGDFTCPHWEGQQAFPLFGCEPRCERAPCSTILRGLRHVPDPRRPGGRRPRREVRR